MRSKRWARSLLVAGTVVAATLPLVLALEATRIPEWQPALAEYLAEAGIPLADVRMVWVAPASHAGRFPTGVLEPVPTDWTWQGIAQIPPPKKVLCVRLEKREGSAEPVGWATSGQFLMGYHDDQLYRAGWVVHRPTAGMPSDKMGEIFARMGCNRWEGIPPERLR